ncbi:tRNA-specific adenosine deaminase [Clostridia bacterium]|nr:tRNA-specific adenosine deaminase [Clostridia bacterium]
MIVTLDEGMRLALLEADQAALEGEIPVGAVIVKGDEILARAHNRCEATGDPTAHAELMVIRDAIKVNNVGQDAVKVDNVGWGSDKTGKVSRSLADCVMFVTLEPCPMCAGAIRLARLGAVYYGAADERQGCCGSVYRLTEDPALGGLIPASGGALARECEEKLVRFFNELRQR